MKKTPRYIIILHKSTKNHDHMQYCSWDMADNRYNGYFSFWAIFCSFTAQKIKISQKWKKTLDISLVYTCVPKIMIRWCTVPQKWCATDGQTEKVTHRGGCPMKKKTPWDIIILHKYTKNQNHMLYRSWDMARDGSSYFSFLAIFCSFTPLAVRKIKIKKKMKTTPGDIIILHRCTKNCDQMLYGS